MSLNISRARELLQAFNFGQLFIEELGWSSPSLRRALTVAVDQGEFAQREIAELGGVVVFEVTSADGKIPDAKTRSALHKEISKHYHENLLVFVDKLRTQSLWYWVKREANRRHPRDHHYFKGQPGDLFLSKLSAMFFDIGELDEQGNVTVVEVARRIQAALDVEPVTKKFYKEYQEEHVAFAELIEGIDDEREHRWYASVLLNRLMFIYFLQRKYFLDDGNPTYLQDKLAESKNRGHNRYYGEFLKALFFQGFAKPMDQRSPEANALLGNIRHLNGGLFLPHRIELQWQNIKIPDTAFEGLLDLFSRYSWNLDDTPGGQDDEINPSVLGYIFEKYINQKALGAFYTRTEITEYLCEKTIHKLILDKINFPGVPGVLPSRQFDSIPDLLMNLDAGLCRQLLDILSKLSLLDPACGSGAFLVAAMRTLINIYSAIMGKIEFLNDRYLNDWLKQARAGHPNLSYHIKKSIITENLFGVDIMEEATEIARLRLFLALVASARTVDELEPLPNIDFNILAGNSLIGLLRVEEADYKRHNPQMSLFNKPYSQVVEEKNRLIATYRHTATYAEDLQSLRDNIDSHRAEANQALNAILLDEFSRLGIKYEQAAWDEKKKTEGKPKKRGVQAQDIAALHPFHWGYEFDKVMNERGGFDAIITNPPWETFQPDGKEFFLDYSDVVTKKSMSVHYFESEVERLLLDKEIRNAWFEYQAKFSHQREYFRFAPQYKHQVPIIDGKRHGKDVNLYKLFLEQVYNLLRTGGLCGIVIPSGIYTDLGAKALRELLLEQTQITGLFGFENRKEVFEGVHRSFKFVVLTFEKGGETLSFPAAFMRYDVAELAQFPREGAIAITVPLVRRLSPDSVSVMEFKNELDVHIAEKMIRFPLLGEEIANVWKMELHREFNMTDDAYLFNSKPKQGFSPLYEGKMIWQFSHTLAEPRYWIKVSDGRKAVLGRETDTGQELGYQRYRLAYRSIASNTNERTLICTIIPPCFTGNSLNVCDSLGDSELLFCAGVLNSFVVDWLLRIKVTTNINMFYVYQLPVPRLTAKDTAFAPIVARASKLICTTPEFDDLAKAIGLKNHRESVTQPAERARLRAELDGLVANLYELTEDEFAHVLGTFPLVSDEEKAAALKAYRDAKKGIIK